MCWLSAPANRSPPKVRAVTRQQYLLFHRFCASGIGASLGGSAGSGSCHGLHHVKVPPGPRTCQGTPSRRTRCCGLLVEASVPPQGSQALTTGHLALLGGVYRHTDSLQNRSCKDNNRGCSPPAFRNHQPLTPFLCCILIEPLLACVRSAFLSPVPWRGRKVG